MPAIFAIVLGIVGFALGGEIGAAAGFIIGGGIGIWAIGKQDTGRRPYVPPTAYEGGMPCSASGGYCEHDHIGGEEAGARQTGHTHRVNDDHLAEFQPIHTGRIRADSFPHAEPIPAPPIFTPRHTEAPRDEGHEYGGDIWRDGTVQ